MLRNKTPTKLSLTNRLCSPILLLKIPISNKSLPHLFFPSLLNPKAPNLKVLNPQVHLVSQKTIDLKNPPRDMFHNKGKKDLNSNYSTKTSQTSSGFSPIMSCSKSLLKKTCSEASIMVSMNSS